MAYECVLKCGNACNPSDNITQGKWDSLQSKSKAWRGLDRFGDVYDTTSWGNGPAGYYMHKSCYITISSSVQLKKSQQRIQKESELAQCLTQASTIDKCDDVPEEPPPPKRLRSSVGGPLHEKTKCVWCMKGEDKKHPNRSRSNLYRINTRSAWRIFKRHPVLIGDTDLRNRLTRLVESTSALSDPFANDIMYHHACWQKYINHVKLRDDDAMHLQNVSLFEARSLFFKHVDNVIFKDHEIRSL